MNLNRDEFLTALHGVGVLLAMTITKDRWVGVCHDSCERYWLCEGTITSVEDIKRYGLKTIDHCHADTYEKALVAFRYWWDRDFESVPVCSALTPFSQDN